MRLGGDTRREKNSTLTEDNRMMCREGNKQMRREPGKNHFRCLLAGLLLLLAAFGEAAAEAEWPRIAISRDGTPISHEVFGAGEPTLVFVHGWSCDARYWRAQVPEFAQKHRVVVLDLAGHGHSGMSRTRYSMGSFGEDVRAVVEATGSGSVILIGHSMGGPVIAEAARLMPDRVVGLIGVDTFHNIEHPMTREELAKMTGPLKENFREASRGFVGGMIAPATAPQLREWILADMSTAPPAVALSAMDEMMHQSITGEAAKVFEGSKIPVVAVNGDLWPVDYEANRRHMFSFSTIVLEGADHFLMLARPGEFNQALAQAIRRLTEK